MSIRELARRSQLDPTFLSRVERGEERLSVRSLARVARVLGLRELTKLLGPWVENDGSAG
jgi:transcriptional regulator with XRE-family HTH domain